MTAEVKGGREMREILFKAKDAKTKEWLEGYPVYFDAELGGEWYSCFIQTIGINYNGERRLGLLMPVIPETVCQYTGFKKMWEGDIVRNRGKWSENIGVIVFRNGRFMVDWRIRNKYSDKGISSRTDDLCADDEVIGNIFDNKELLEGD